jgi:branched-subunit amino acid aminotransferase/4-amino-4-deoxychorismate lyase
MTIYLDGAFVPDNQLPKRTGFAPFETIGAEAFGLPLWRVHHERLAQNAATLRLAFAPPADLYAQAGQLLRHNGDTDGVLRWLLLPSGQRVHVVLSSRARSPLKVMKLLPTVVERPATAPPGDIKAEPRAFYDAVRQQAQDGGADDGIVIGPAGEVLETAIGNLLLRLDGRWVTPALDGRVLPGVGRALLLAAARTAGQPIAEQACGLPDLHRAEALCHLNAVYGPRPAHLLEQANAGIPFVERELRPLWQQALRAAPKPL